MSIYSKEQLVKMVENKTHEELQAIVNKIIYKTEAKTAYENLANSIMGVSPRGKPQILISNKKSVDINSINKIKNSRIMKFIPALIEAALRLDGPFQTREIMMVAALSFEGAYYIKNSKIHHGDKVMVGHILIMAGFERISHYDRETKRPVKAWKLRYGQGSTDNSMRAEIVYNTIRTATINNDINETQSKLDELV
jgi:hypothetical protein